MPKRSWGEDFVTGLGIVAGVALLFWISLDWVALVTEQRVAEYYSAYGHEDQAARIANEACSHVVGAAANQCIFDEAQSYIEGKEEYKDHQAQIRMAFWAFWAVLITGIATLTGLYGLWLLRRTWRETKRTADIAREIGEAQVRAYLTVESASVTASEIKEDRVWWTITISLDNGGQSPARGVNVAGSVDGFKTVFGAMFPDISAGKPAVGTVIYSVAADDLVFTDKSMAITFFHVRLRIRFMDVFGKTITDYAEVTGFPSPVPERVFPLTVSNLIARKTMVEN